MKKSDYAIFEEIPVEDIDFGKYGDYTVIYDKGIEVKYMIIHEIGLIVIHPRINIDDIIERSSKEMLTLAV